MGDRNGRLGKSRKRREMRNVHCAHAETGEHAEARSHVLAGVALLFLRFGVVARRGRRSHLRAMSHHGHGMIDSLRCGHGHGARRRGDGKHQRQQQAQERPER